MAAYHGSFFVSAFFWSTGLDRYASYRSTPFLRRLIYTKAVQNIKEKTAVIATADAGVCVTPVGAISFSIVPAGDRK